MMQKTGRFLAGVLLMAAMILTSTLLAGCVEIGETGDSGESGDQNIFSGFFSPEPDTSLSPDQDFAPVPAAPIPAALPVTSSPGSATYTDPIPPGVATQRDFRNLTSPAADLSRPFDYSTAPFFTETFSPCYTNSGILATDVTPPFVIEFRTDANSKNPYESLVIITVRDPVTGEIIAEDGYNGMYTSEEEKRIIIRSGGTYHVNVYGYGASVRLALRGGVPADMAVPYGFTAPTPSPQQDNYEEWDYFEPWMR